MSNRRKPAHRDNLSATQHNILIELFLLPAKIILWFQYMNPSGGYANTRMVARRARSPIVTYIVAIAFWAGVGWLQHEGLLMPLLENIVNAVKGLL